MLNCYFADSMQQEVKFCIELLDQFFKQGNTIVRGVYLAKGESSAIRKGGSVVEYISRILGTYSMSTKLF